MFVCRWVAWWACLSTAFSQLKSDRLTNLTLLQKPLKATKHKAILKFYLKFYCVVVERCGGGKEKHLIIGCFYTKVQQVKVLIEFYLDFIKYS